ncbi:MAG: glutaredoxin 3 [Coxiellaceae bacterium]|nr:MAG: glutaredoxin 3 [Coxiellaceae bacterium]
MAEVVIYTKDYCPYCTSAKQFLAKKNIAYTEIRVDLEPERLPEMIQRSGRRTVPQIFINGQSIGGWDDLYALEKAGKLDKLLG